MPACIYFLRLRSALLLTNRGYVSLRRLCNLPWTNAHPSSTSFYFHCSPFEKTHCMAINWIFRDLGYTGLTSLFPQAGTGRRRRPNEKRGKLIPITLQVLAFVITKELLCPNQTAYNLGSALGSPDGPKFA